MPFFKVYYKVAFKFVEQNPSREINVFSPSQKFTNISWNPKLRYHLKINCPLFYPELNPFHTLISQFSKTLLLLCSHLRLGFTRSPLLHVSEQYLYLKIFMTLFKIVQISFKVGIPYLK